MANQTDTPPARHDLGPGAKVGVAVAAALAIVALFSTGLLIWWRRRQKRQMAKEMVSFVDGDIVNLVDGGRFEKPYSKPTGAYDPYLNHGSSSSSVTPSPVYFQPPASFTEPPLEPPSGPYNEQPAGNYYQQPSTGYSEYYAPFPASAPAVSVPSLPPSRDMPPPAPQPIHSITPPPPPATTTESHAWSNAMRHPWSPPDYDTHSPTSESSMQEDNAFQAISRQVHSTDASDHYPVVALPAILPDPRPEPQAELPARDIHGRGDELELPAPELPPLRRQGPPQGNDIDEQKFLLSDVLILRQQKSIPGVRGNPPG